MRNILIILALFVCTSICLGDREVSIIPELLDYKYHKYAANVDAVLVKGWDYYGDNDWIAPVGCILNIDKDDARIGYFACGARMCCSDKGGGCYVTHFNFDTIDKMTGNKINVHTGLFKNSIIAGAYSEDIRATVDNNAVTITAKKGGTIQNVYGGRTHAISASSNTVTISGVDIGDNANKGRVCGGYVAGRYVQKGGLARDNKVRIDGNGKIEGEVYGGYIEENGTATLNEVDLTSVTVSSNVYGARIGNGLAEDNKVRIDGNGKIEGNVYGGYIEENGTATINEVNLTSVTVSSNVYGARIKNGLAEDNKVKIDGNGKIEGNVYGGYIEEKGTATINKVNLTSVTVSSNVFGARIGNGLARDNRVTIEGGKIEGEVCGVCGGYIVNNGTTTENKVNLTSVTVTKDVFGAWIESGLVSSNTVTIISGSVRNVYGGYILHGGTATENKVNLTGVKVTRNVYGAQIGYGDASSNTVTIISGTVENVYGGYILLGGTATINKVNLTSVTITKDVYGAKIQNFRIGINDGYASSNTVTITSGIVDSNVYGGCIVGKGTATENKVNLTSVTVSINVCGAKIEKDGLASSNTVTITDGIIGVEDGKEGSVYGGYIGQNGTASSNTVTINGGKIEEDVIGGFVGGNGKAIYNTITITGVTEFSTATILCGGICANKATADASTNDAFTGNTLNIVETKGVVVNGISNFENYNFHLKDIKHGEVILTATSGGRSWDVGELKYTTACTVDLSRSNIHLRTQSVLNKGEYCTLIKSPQGFKDNIACKKFDFDNGGLVEYSWEIKIADNKQDLIATLNRKELREEKAKPLLEGNVTGMVCINNGMDCIISKMEETESVLGEGAKLQRKGEIGAFYGLLANKSSYDDTGSHIDMTGMSMMGGVGIRVEVGEKEPSSREQSSKELSSKEFSSKKLSFKELISELSFKGLSSELTVGVFGEYGTGNSDIDSGLCPCKKKSEGTSKYVGGGLLGRYNVCEDEFRGTKLYLEAILRAGEVSNTFNIKEAKDGAEKECKYNDETTTYGGCALGGGYKHKVGEKMDVDWSLRYMFGYQDGKDVEKPVDVYGNRVKLESVKSSRIRIGVRGKYVELEKVKPYIGIWYEHELSGKVKGAIQNGVDNVGDIPATSFEGGTGIGELGVSVKIGKLDVGISGQGYLGVRKGFGGMLKLKYAFGKDAHAKPPKP